ncbi:MAG: glycogen/starch synthase [Desulfurococcaceae archaeon]
MHAPPRIERVWMLTFEFSGVAKVGGLGEMVSLVSSELAKRGLDLTVIMPSHGVRPSNFRELDVECSGNRHGADGNTYPYDLAFLEGVIGGVRVVLVKGKNSRTSMVLNTWPPYNHVDEKACLLARAVRCLAQKHGYPDLVHANDWHSALAAVVLKVDAELRGYSLPVLYQVHLRGSPSYPWHYASEEWCGVPDAVQRLWAVTRHIFESTRSLWNGCWGSVECFIVKLADAVATVSRSEVELLARDYGEWIRGKSCYSYNSTSWSVKDVEEVATSKYSSSRRERIRWKVVEDSLRSSSVWGHLEIEDGEVLVVASGRLTPQKGFDTLLYAARFLPPSIKVIILGLRVGNDDYEAYLKSLLDSVKGRAVIAVEGPPPPLYQLLIYVAHVYALPSRYEPFGIAGIEALALGTPLVASAVGGLREYVSDLRTTPLGVGILVQPNNAFDLATAIQSLGYLMYYGETGKGLDKVVTEELRSMAVREPKFGERLRKVAVNYVDAFFRPEHTVNSILSCYELARRMAYYRAHA